MLTRFLEKFSKVLLFWIYLIFLMLVFVLQWLSLHWQNQIMLLSFHWLSVKLKTGYPVSLHSLADWYGLHGHLRDFPWENIFKLSYSTAASEFCVWVQVVIDVYIPHHKYQVKPHSSPWFSAACAAASVHRNHFFHLYQVNLLNLK